MAPLTETDWHRRQINAFVDAQKIEVELTRPIKTTTADGGTKQTGSTTLEVQVFRLVPFKRRLVQEYGFSDVGEQVNNTDYVLVGRHDADVMPGDYFVWSGLKHVVEFISEQRLFRTAAGVRIRGTPAPE